MGRRLVALPLLVLAFVLARAVLPAAPAQTKILTPLNPKPVSSRTEYTVRAGDFYMEGRAYGFNVTGHSRSVGSTCRVSDGTFSQPSEGNLHYLVLQVDSAASLLGSKCDFTVFEPALLKNGFVFKKFTGRLYYATTGHANLQLKTSPVPGSASVKFTFHGWADAGGQARYDLLTLILEGPAGRDWKDALR